MKTSQEHPQRVAALSPSNEEHKASLSPLFIANPFARNSTYQPSLPGMPA